MVEFALILPFIIIILFVIIDFSWILTNELTISNAAREGARIGIVYSSDEDYQIKIKNRIVEIINVSNTNIEIKKEQSTSGTDMVVTIQYSLPLLTPLGTLLFDDGIYIIDKTCVMKI